MTASAVTLPETAYGSIDTDVKETIVVQEVAPQKNTEAIVRSYFKDIPVMAEVARCESEFRQHLADGSVLQGRVDPADTGVMQINKRYHLSKANSMDINLDDIYGNMAYARHLYETEGTRPWNSSMPCWGNTLAANR